MKNLHYIFFCFLQVASIVSFAQNQNIKFEHLDINEGLSQNNILCILQDSKGFMWFGTRDGLNKYDGYQFTVYKNDIKDKHSIRNNFISAIAEDAQGILWITTRGGGLNRYDRNKDQFASFMHQPGNNNSVSNNLLDALAIDKNDNLWMCTETNGIDFFDPHTGQFSHYKHNGSSNSLSNDNTRYVMVDSKNNIWVGGYGGLSYLDRKSNMFKNYSHDMSDDRSLSNNNVRVIFEDSKKRIWTGTVGGGLNLFEESTGTFRHFVNNTSNAGSLSINVVAAIGEDDAGNIWVGTENGGLCILDPATGVFQTFKYDDIDKKSISQNSIYSIYRDADNNMWVGTFSGGINIFSKAANRFSHYYHTSSANSLNNNNVLCIAENTEGKLLVGTDGGGLNVFDPVTKNFQHFLHDEKNKNSICGNYILSVCEDSKGNIWIGSWADGLTVFNPKQNTYRHFKNNPADPSSISSNNVWVIMEDNEKNMWIGTYGEGLNLFNPDKSNFTRFPDSSLNTVEKQVYTIADDKKGNLWLGTDGGGILLFNKRQKAFTRLLPQIDKSGTIDNRINYLRQDVHGNFWINTMSGLIYLDPNSKKFSKYTTEDGLPNNVIFATAEDAKGNLWISTNRGISRFDPASKKFKNFTLSDGLQSYEFKGHAVCKTRTGAIYFGGINGFNEFYPDKIDEKKIGSRPVFTSLQLFNKKVRVAQSVKDPSPLKQDISETKEIILSYKNAVITFEFASLYFGAEDKKNYAYMLEGFDKDWNFSGTRRSVTYTNLDPRKYTFKVRGVDNRGDRSSEVSSVLLTITPPFWLTWWFKTLAFMTGILVVAGFMRYRINTIEAQKAKLAAKVDEQTVQLLQSANEEKKAREQAERANLDAQQANEDLAQKNKELEQFVYIASHDLQEPLRTTTSFVELLQRQYRGQLDEKADKYFTFITDSSTRMKTLIKDLLDYSRIGAKKEFVPVDCDVIIHEVLDDLGNAISQAQAVITTDQLPLITGYPTEIKQLFQNLVINAIKFRKKDVAPHISVSLKNRNDQWQFAVKDNGIGIEEQHKEKVFMIFQRLHTKAAYEGSGIGLAHSKKIVELHGGKIWIDSVYGEGTTFNFTISKNIICEKQEMNMP
jgi:ligand-binding sensor domain-containing protein/signal transduction histidine kinase